MGKPQIRNIKILVDNSGAEPVTVAEVKTYLQLEGSGYDALIEPVITQVRKQVESFCDVSLSTKEIQTQIFNKSDLPMVLPYPPVSGISEIKWKKCPAQWIVLQAGYDYDVDDNFDIDSSEAGLHQITYTTEPDTDASLLQAIVIQVGYLFTQRDEAAVNGWSNQAMAILNTRRNAAF
jgi:hypothetical protein